jgi:ADP-ribose pyrophosphatase YjhB (NUDIX family)
MSEKPLREAVALVFREGDKVRAFKRSMSKSVYQGLWSIPSTYIEEGESVTETANRLAQKKLGLESVTLALTPLGESGAVEKENIFLSMTDYEVLSYIGTISFNPEEYTEQRLVTPKELYELVMAQEVEDKGECTKTFLRAEGLM